MKKGIAIIVFGLLWCTYSSAGLLSDETIKANIEGCKKDQYSSSNNQGISKSILDKYCVCYVYKIDQNLTQNDINYFNKYRKYPERFNLIVFEASKQCYLSVIAN